MRFILRLISFALIAAVVTPAVRAQRQGGPNTVGRPNGQDANGGRGRPGGAGRGDAGRGRGPEFRIGTASIRGRVLSATGGTPVRRATIQAAVLIEGGRPEPPRSVVTDDNGAFELRDLPAGRWMLTASKTGFIQQQFGQKSAFASTDAILLAEGQRFVADFKLSRGGAISGRVTDEFGEPIAGANVAASRLQNTQDGVRMMRTGTTVPSDDNGTYRVYGLPPGQYYVAVNDSSVGRAVVLNGDPVFVNANGAFAGGTARIETQESFSNQLETLVSRSIGSGPAPYAPTYYPGTANITEAQRITLGAGEEQLGINLAVVPVRAARITGRITSSNGQPMQATVALTSPLQNIVPNSGSSRSNPDGTFTLTNVPPGTYSLDVLGPNVGAVPPEVATIPLNVNGADVLDLSVVTGPGATVSGTVVTENGMRLPATKMSVTAAPSRNGSASFTPRGDVGATGTFELEGLAGVYTLRFSALPAGWAIKSITANGIDVSDSALEFRPGDRVAVRVELTDRITEVSGTIRSDHDLRGAYILVLPDEPAKWTNSSRFIRAAKVADDGHFSVSGLPPYSRYLALAIDYLEDGDQRTPEFLQRAKTAATASFGLSAGEKKTLDLPLVTR